MLNFGHGLKITFAAIIIAAIIMLTKWTNKRGWTSFYRKYAGGKMLSVAMSAVDQILFEERRAAIEYRKEEKADRTETGEYLK